jgi:hypothetical protein
MLALAAGSYFSLSLFDRLWHPDLTEVEAVEMIEKAIAEVKKRLVVAPAHYVIKVVDKDGIRWAAPWWGWVGPGLVDELADATLRTGHAVCQAVCQHCSEVL